MENREIIASRSREFHIDISEMPTTGYRWKCVERPTEIILVGDGFIQNSLSEQLDAKGTHRFTFFSEKTGSFILKFALKREWEESVSSIITYLVEVRETC